jgi:aspartyl-tRNA(Asn)/glutamyl-tRNA(Gln) amidotransferase subunit B
VTHEAVIGLEVHAQMLTETKIFCGCSTRFGASPNSQTCPVCTGMPGVLPVLNRKALEFAVLTGLAMNCSISLSSRFARKNYFYPDLPKGYQISQYELPICEHGWVELALDGERKRIGITRIHMEEDAGKNIHEGRGNHSFVDLNRTGVPLMEIVSEPDIRSAREAAEYMKKVRSIVRYIGVSDGNMEQGSLRCDANISVRPRGQTELGTKVELKNMNSFRFVERAIDYEIRRQTSALGSGEPILQETRLWDADAGVTVSMRSKEEAHDYRYFPDPDLVPIALDENGIEAIRARLPELPDAREKRFMEEYALPGQDSENTSIEDCPLTPGQLVGMLKLIENGTVSHKMAKTVFEDMYRSGKDPDEVVKEKGLVQISDEGVIEKAVDEVLGKNPDAVERYRGGEQKLMGFFVGQVMKATRGKANPKAVNELLRKKLGA